MQQRRSWKIYSRAHWRKWITRLWLNRVFPFHALTVLFITLEILSSRLLPVYKYYTIISIYIYLIHGHGGTQSMEGAADQSGSPKNGITKNSIFERFTQEELSYFLGPLASNLRRDIAFWENLIFALSPLITSVLLSSPIRHPLGPSRRRGTSILRLCPSTLTCGWI